MAICSSVFRSWSKSVDVVVIVGDVARDELEVGRVGDGVADAHGDDLGVGASVLGVVGRCDAELDVDEVDGAAIECLWQSVGGRVAVCQEDDDVSPIAGDLLEPHVPVGAATRGGPGCRSVRDRLATAGHARPPELGRRLPAEAVQGELGRRARQGVDEGDACRLHLRPARCCSIDPERSKTMATFRPQTFGNGLFFEAVDEPVSGRRLVAADGVEAGIVAVGLIVVANPHPRPSQGWRPSQSGMCSR